MQPRFYSCLQKLRRVHECKGATRGMRPHGRNAQARPLHSPHLMWRLAHDELKTPTIYIGFGLTPHAHDCVADALGARHADASLWASKQALAARGMDPDGWTSPHRPAQVFFLHDACFFVVHARLLCNSPTRSAPLILTQSATPSASRAPTDVQARGACRAVDLCLHALGCLITQVVCDVCL